MAITPSASLVRYIADGRCVLFVGAEQVVPKEHPPLAFQQPFVVPFPAFLCGLVLLFNGEFLGLGLCAAGPEGGNLHYLVPEMDMGQPEAPPHEPAVPEEPPDLLRGRIGDDVEILGGLSDKQVPDRAPHPANRTRPAKKLMMLRTNAPIARAKNGRCPIPAPPFGAIRAESRGPVWANFSGRVGFAALLCPRRRARLAHPTIQRYTI